MKTVSVKIFWLILIFIIGFSLSCDEYRGLTVDCSECYSVEPDSGDLIIYLTIDNENPRIPLTVFKEKVDDEWIEYIDTAFSSPYYLYVKLNEYYSVKAKYNSGDRIIYAVDGDKIKTKFVTETCEFDCWGITGGIINLELKVN
jgi:hypothetical protein